MALTFTDLQNQVLDITKSAFYTDATRVGQVVNETYLDIVQRILTPVKTTSPATLTNAVADYDLTAAPFSLTDFIGIRDVIYNQSGSGPNRTLVQVTPHEIYQQRNQTYSGFLYAFALEGTTKLMLAPSPSTGDTIYLAYNYRPAAMVNPTDTALLLPEEDHDAIVVGAARRVARWKNPQLWAQLNAEYNLLVDAAQARQNRKGGSAGQKMRRIGTRRPPHDNSTDTRGWY